MAAQNNKDINFLQYSGGYPTDFPKNVFENSSTIYFSYEEFSKNIFREICQVAPEILQKVEGPPNSGWSPQINS